MSGSGVEAETSVDFLLPSSGRTFTTEEAPYDPSKVRRSKDGRPYVKVPCPDSTSPDPWEEDLCRDGRVPGKRPGTTKACPTCKGKGDQREVLYSRCTSFVDVMESRNQLEDWKQRAVLIGIARDEDPDGLYSQLRDIRHRLDDRDALDRIREEAFEAGDGYVKSQKGTDLHALSEDVDRGLILGTSLRPRDDGTKPPVTLQDRADMAAYRRTMEAHGIEVLDIECFVVNDRYRIGGTFDRRVLWMGSKESPRGPARCCNLPKILDLKTGRVDVGAGKIAQQLAVYANSENYDPLTGTRSPLDVCPHIGLALHLPQGTGTASLMTADLVKGYEAVAKSEMVRQYRNESKGWLQPVPSDDPISFTVNP